LAVLEKSDVRQKRQHSALSTSHFAAVPAPSSSSVSRLFFLCCCPSLSTFRLLTLGYSRIASPSTSSGRRLPFVVVQSIVSNKVTDGDDFVLLVSGGGCITTSSNNSNNKKSGGDVLLLFRSFLLAFFFVVLRLR